MPTSAFSQLNPLLQAVSRSFYLTLRILPASIRPQIGLAYLLARATDTIADTGIVPQEQRIEALRRLRDRILGLQQTGVDFRELARHQGTPSERVLLERIEEALTVLAGFTTADQQLIREVLTTITGGQELDLQRFSGAEPGRIIALRTEDELDDYTYRVAGCVGEFWTHICRSHLFPKEDIDDYSLLSRGLRFGKGLQMVNILRDLPADLRAGRCYLPTEGLANVGLSPEALLDPANEPALRPYYRRLLAQAHAHLEAGWAYTNTLPGRMPRLRLACAWPLLIAARTLEKLDDGNVLIPDKRIKVSRAQVQSLLLRSILLYPFPGAWDHLFQPHVPRFRVNPVASE